MKKKKKILEFMVWMHPDYLGGEAVVKGTRIPIDVLEYELDANGLESVLKDFPTLKGKIHERRT